MNMLLTGANRGLGFELTKLGLEKGWTVFAGVRDPAKLSTQFTELKEKFSTQLTVIALDVTVEHSVLDAIGFVRTKVNHLNAVINNAGILVETFKSIEELDIEACMRCIDVNTLGPIRVVKHTLPLIEEGEKAAIINISSDAASLTIAKSGNYPYGISKAALNMFSEKLHVTLKDKNIRVCSIHPGWLKTDMGGGKAPGDPSLAAEDIWFIIERKVDVQSVFIDAKGKPFPI